MTSSTSSWGRKEEGKEGSAPPSKCPVLGSTGPLALTGKTERYHWGVMQGPHKKAREHTVCKQNFQG